MKKVLVTGGAGFIGSAVLREFQRSGEYEVFVLDDLSVGKREFINIDDEHFINADILDRQLLDAIFKKVNPVWLIHLAAIHFIPYCNKYPYKSSNINIRGTINVLDAAKDISNLEKILFASTAAVYPIYDGPVSEQHKVEPLDIYGLTKLAGERLCSEFFLKSGLPTIVCRLFNAFGPNETNPHLIPEIQKQINEGRRIINLGNLTPKRDFIHTYDMARAIRLLLQVDDISLEIFNLGRGIEYSVTEVVDSFERQLGEKITVKVEESRVRKTERMHLLADISKIKARTGWSPEWSLDDGIRTLLTEV